MRSHFTTTRLDTLQKSIINVGEDVEILKSSYTAGWNVKSCDHYGKKVEQFPKMLNMKLLYGPATPLLVM